MERAPPTTEISPTAKLEDDSLRVKVKEAVSPALRVLLSAVINKVGEVVFITQLEVALAIKLFPAESRIPELLAAKIKM